MPVPKGIRFRATPDWFSQYLSQGGHGVPSNSLLDDFQAIALYNDSQLGALLFIYAISSVSDQNDYFEMAMVNGTIGSFQRQGTRVNPSIGSPPGQIYYYHDPSTALPITPIGYWCEFDPPGMGGVGPLYIVPAGFSIVFQGPRVCAEMMINFWYLPMVDQKGYKPA